MGYIKHHAIVITGYDDAKINKVRDKICQILDTEFGEDVSDTMVTPILSARTNGYLTFFVGPDGSKEGWETSNNGDSAREKIKSLLAKPKNYHDFAELYYGEDNGYCEIVDHN